MRKKLLIGGVSLLVLLTVIISVGIFQKRLQVAQRISDDTAQTKLYLTPATGQFDTNSPVDTTVTLDAGSNTISGFSTTIQYDTSKLTYASYEKTTSSFDTITINSNTAGKIIVVAEANPLEALPTGNSMSIIKVHFTSKDVQGSTNIGFTETTVIGATYTEVLTSAEASSTYQIGGAPITSVSPISTSPSITNPPQNCLPYGDVDGNGTVNAADVSLISKYIDGTGTLTVGQFSRADITRDTQVQQFDYNSILPLVEGKWAEVFPGNPLLCPSLLPFHIGFKDKQVTLNTADTQPVANSVVISNPYKLPVKSVTFRGAYNSSAIRATGVRALKGTFTQPPEIQQNSFTAHITLDPPVTDQEFEVASVDIIPYLPGGTGSDVTFSNLYNAPFQVDVVRVGNETVPGSLAVKAGDAHYTVVRSGTSLSPSISIRPTINASPPVGGASVKISVTLPAIGTAFDTDNKNPIETERDAQIQLVGPNNAAPITASGTVSFDGTAYTGYVIIPNITPGNYQIKVRLSSTLYKVIPGVFNLSDISSINTPTVRLVNGDFNQDQTLDLLDYNIMLTCVQNKPACDEATKKLTDLNSDGKTSEADYSIFLRQFEIREGD